MIEPNILAFQNAAVLEALADPAASGVTTLAELAKRFERDPDNFRKTLKRLQEDGILQDPPLSGLTDAGRDQLAAFKRAVHGGERRKAQGRWPLDRFRRNPLNRAIDPEAVLGLADTIVGVGDILMPLVVSPPDAEGVRTIWAGERRWMAATRLAQMDQLPEALLPGLPFTERAADKGEAAVITLIENGARADLTPWDDARQLRIAADATGLNATELARKIGRARDGDRGGVRDVQVKIKVAREATPDAIAAYEADPTAPGAWEALRDSVSKPKAAEIVTTKAQRLALAELFHKAGGQVGRDVAILPAGHAVEGQRLAQYRFAILTRNDRGDTARVTQEGLNYLQEEGLSGSIENARAKLGYPEGYGVARYRTEWLNTPVATAAAPADDGETAAYAGIEPIGDVAERVATPIATYTLANPRLPAGTLLLRIEIGRHDDGTFTFATGWSTPAGEGSSYGLSFVEARKRAIPTEREALIVAVNELRTETLNPRVAGNDARTRTVWLDRVLAGQHPADGPATAGAEDPLVVNGVRYPNLARANEAKRAAGILPRQANSGGGAHRAQEHTSLKAAPADLGHQCETPPDTEASRDDAALAEAEAETEAKAARILTEVRAFADEDGLAQPFGGWRFRQLLSSLSTAGPFVGAANGGSDDPNESGCVFDANDCVVAVVDVHGEGPDAAADAQAELIAYALNFACARGADDTGSRTMAWPDAPENETPEAAIVRTGRILERCMGDAATVAGDAAELVETLRQFRSALTAIERLPPSAEAA